MLNSAHSSLADQMSAESWQNYLQALAPLGELNVLQHITGQAAVPLIPGISAGTASYDVELDFSRATAQAKVDLLLENGQWQITSWIISSPLTDE
jgi:hypothetical protein